MKAMAEDGLQGRRALAARAWSGGWAWGRRVHSDLPLVAALNGGSMG